MSFRDQQPPLTFSQVAQPPGMDAEMARRLCADYRAWRKFRYVAAELGVEPEAAWSFVKFFRRLSWRQIGVPRIGGGGFGINLPASMARSLFLIDRAAERGLVARTAGNGAARQKRLDALFRGGELIPGRLQVGVAMTEATESSLMEGASATRAQARELLRTARTPVTVGERMILNNFHAMQLVKSRLDEPLSIELLLEFQDTLTRGTLGSSDASGRLRDKQEDVRVVDSRDNSTIFVPPPAEDLPALLRSICAFANCPGQDFLHPVVAASILHFLIGYAHPFVDGNGRTARAAFYWQALRHGYGIFEYLSISEIIGKGYARYPQAYVDTELDDGDLTYFVLYKLDVIEQALDRLAIHLQEEEVRLARSDRLAEISVHLNLRQRILLDHALQHPLTQYTVKSHKNSNGITPVTARADLEGLVKLRLMTTLKRGKEVIYMASPKLAERVDRKGR